ncbi:hypothetical protein SPH9361_04951 [Sphingobium sp. CECT 9361]|nr:hypothetical protein SPH9361_04951 [Sphingobium sp. CECT 9361]
MIVDVLVQQSKPFFVPVLVQQLGLKRQELTDRGTDSGVWCNVRGGFERLICPRGVGRLVC